MTSSSWQRSESDTSTLRQAIDCQPDACVYRRKDMLALVFVDDHEPNSWHLYLAVMGGKRLPTLDELLDARLQLLPGIDDFAIATASGLDFPVLHLWELPWADDPDRRAS